MLTRDILYGQIEVPELLAPFLTIPEFVRLRGVRLSNVDSIQFKDFNGPTRWDHAIGVLHLAQICAKVKGLDRTQTLHLSLAALLHDIATPPFAHTAEYVLSDFDHENETGRLLAGELSQDVAPYASLYLSETAQFRKACASLSHDTGLHVDMDEVARMVIGEGELGYLIAGTLDLDNADNVTRAMMFMGFPIDRTLPERLASWLGTQDAAPLDLSQSTVRDVITWLDYRKTMYGSFYEATVEERGREAYLQHLFRRALAAGVSRHQLVWNTDDGFLSLLSAVKDYEGDQYHIPLSDLARRYRLMESPRYVLGLKIQDPDDFRVLRLAAAGSWIESHLSTKFMEPIVYVTARRFSDPEGQLTLIPAEAGQLQVFVLGSEVTFDVLPAWLQEKIGHRYTGQKLVSRMTEVLRSEIEDWLKVKPWFKADTHRTARVVQQLDAMGDWSFRRSTNEGLHPYPATFVHAIPASMIHALGIAGDDIVDCFGGTGQTAIEAVKTGGRGISADSNYFATLIARARMTYLTPESRDFIRQLNSIDIWESYPASAPDIADLERWHNPRTIEELQSIMGFIGTVSDDTLKLHMQVAFSAILPGTTARKGLQHGFFADNTPLGRGEAVPPYVDAMALFLARMKKNIRVAETLYGSLERQGRTAAEELTRATAVQLDARCGVPADYDVEPGSVAAIITSPPYLCMTDYTLGNRLSYYWLAPERMAVDFAMEICPRRRRPKRTGPNPSTHAERVDRIVASYIADIAKFAQSAASLLRPSGYLAIVLGTPLAEAFEDRRVLDDVDKVLSDCSFQHVWSTWRSISWSRNHGYARLKHERLSVHQLAG
jgi:HD superfamily phosphohydrolase